MADALFVREPGLAKRCGHFSTDRGLDSGPLKKKFRDGWGIRPIIENKEMWREEKKGQSYVEGQKIVRPLGSVHDNVFYTEKADIWCRCPAAVYGLNCKGWEERHRDAGCATGG